MIGHQAIKNKYRKNYFLYKLVPLLIFLILLCPYYRCMALPVWPGDEDIIGIEDNSYMEFKDYKLTSQVINYHVGDEWSSFPHKLTSKEYSPHRVNILFNTQTKIDSRIIKLGLTTDQPSGQSLSIHFNDKQIGCAKVQMGQFESFKFYLGEIKKGEHVITLENITEPDQNIAYGILFDYVSLNPSKTIVIPIDYETISEGIIAANPGDTLFVKNGTYRENNIHLKSNMALLGENPHSTIIDGNGNTIIIGAHNCRINGFTIFNAGLSVVDNQGIGILAEEDAIFLSNNIISSCSIGSCVMGRDITFINNTIVNNNCGIYLQKSDYHSPLPTLRCQNSIFADCNYAIYIYTGSYDDAHAIEPYEIDQVISEFSYNTIDSRFDTNLNLISLGKGNLYNDPLFVGLNHDNYHLQSFSPCIDAGDPNSEFYMEQDNNGQRINIGAFGNTMWATRTYDSDKDGILDFSEGINDMDLDGIPDWLDKQTATLNPTLGEKNICISLAKSTNYKIALSDVKAIDPNNKNLSKTNLPDSSFLFGFWEFEITGLDQNSSASVDIYLPQKLFDIQEYYAYNSYDTWETIALKLDSSSSIISINLSDGGPEDMDGEVNGSISHIGGLTTPLPFHDELKPDSCYISLIL